MKITVILIFINYMCRTLALLSQNRLIELHYLTHKITLWRHIMLILSLLKNNKMSKVMKDPVQGTKLVNAYFEITFKIFNFWFWAFKNVSLLIFAFRNLENMNRVKDNETIFLILIYINLIYINYINSNSNICIS